MSKARIGQGDEYAQGWPEDLPNRNSNDLDIGRRFGPSNPPMCVGTPLSLTATATLSPNSSTGVNAVALQNPDPECGMLIDEIKFLCYNTSLGPASSTTWNWGRILPNIGSSVACQFRLGRLEITSKPVPVWLFGRSDNQLAETNTNVGIAGTFCDYRWRLARPIYVPPGKYVEPYLSHNGFTSSNITFQITYGGRSLPKGFPEPEAIDLPYIAAYVSQPFPQDSTTRTDQSAETDLFNKFDAPLYVQHISGRVAIFGQDTSTTNSFVNDIMPDSDGEGIMTCRMVASSGESIVRDFTSFHEVFGRDTKTWNVRHVMPPHAYYIVFLSNTGGQAAISNATLGPEQGQVAIVGWREVPNWQSQI